MKLEIKHLAPYLPYQLKMQLLDFPLGKHLRTLELDCGHDFHFYLKKNKVRPIIRPLWTITKQQLKILRDENNYDTLLWSINTFDGNFLREYEKDLTYDVIQRLFEWHFDVFGLIEKGLAIDINTLDNG